ncbi:hypothetical protein RCL_jg5951.t1 [Rhizophagus clarus]|uniref:Uncharacterized protein n=1 Tax=Rhizophagus clarus TaxID=94130 RepID=A0A8H3QX02_9GLOM|nr:hypothetical protein RCL_jg5951.t1 [Rhizophagus clarus]
MERMPREKHCVYLSVLIISPSMGRVLQTLYNNNIKEINADPIDLLGQPIDDEKSEMNDEEKLFEEEDDDEQNEY